ncbi:hypothetical protein GCM10027181_19000 [Rheinheimera gaetbuli]
MVIDDISIAAVYALLGLAAGAVLGAGYFAGLWWTVRQLGSSNYPGLMCCSSLLIRVGTVMLGFYLLLLISLYSAALALPGFVLARLFAIRVVQRTEQPDATIHNSRYAP